MIEDDVCCESKERNFSVGKHAEKIQNSSVEGKTDDASSESRNAEICSLLDNENVVISAFVHIVPMAFMKILLEYLLIKNLILNLFLH